MFFFFNLKILFLSIPICECFWNWNLKKNFKEFSQQKINFKKFKGIDDAFLMIHSWQMATSKRRKNNILPAAIISGDVITMEAEKRLKEQQRKQIDSSLAKQLTEVKF